MKIKNEAQNSMLPLEYQAALIGSGLVDGVDNLLALKPIIRTIKENEKLCGPGDPPDRVWVVVRGNLAVREGEHTVALRGRGDVTGELGMIDGVGGRRAELVAVHEEVEVIEILKRAIDSHPQSSILWRNCASVVCRKLDESTNRLQEIRDQRTSLQTLLRLYVGEHALSEGKLAPASVLHSPREEYVIIWFSDIVGFSKIVSNMTPAHSVTLVQRFLTPQVTAIDTRRGFIDKFIGDAVMAYWVVASRTGREECEDALDAAFEVLDHVGEIKVGPEPLQIRIGLHIGKVSIGNFGMHLRSQFTLIGNEVNIASRLENVRNQELERGGPLGPLRVSKAFYDVLGRTAKKRIPVPFSFEAKNVGNVNAMTIHPAI